MQKVHDHSKTPLRTTIEWNGRVYMNVTWFNLTDCTKIVLMKSILHMIKPTIPAQAIFQYLSMDYDETCDWYRAMEDNNLDRMGEKFKELQEAEAIAKVNARTLKYVEAVGDNSTWMSKFYEAHFEYKDPDPDLEYTVTQDEMDNAKRFLLCRRANTRSFEKDLLARLDLFVGQTFSQEPELPDIFKQDHQPVHVDVKQDCRTVHVEKAPDALKLKRAYLCGS